jgi:hypothetical protein
MFWTARRGGRLNRDAPAGGDRASDGHYVYFSVHRDDDSSSIIAAFETGGD